METELEQLVAEQQRDDSPMVWPEFREQVPFTDELANHIGTEPDGEIVSSLPRPPRGTVLVGGAVWHGTRDGYNNHECRCDPCRTAQRDYRRQRRKNGGS